MVGGSKAEIAWRKGVVEESYSTCGIQKVEEEGRSQGQEHTL